MALSTLSQCRVAGVKLRKDALLSLVEALRSGRFSEPDQVGGLSDQTLRNQLLLRGFALAAHPGTDRDVLEAKLEELILKESGLDVKLALSIGTAEWGEESASASATESFDSAASGEDDEGSGEEQLRGAFSTAQEELPPELAAAAAHMWRPFANEWEVECADAQAYGPFFGSFSMRLYADGCDMFGTFDFGVLVGCVCVAPDPPGHGWEPTEARYVRKSLLRPMPKYRLSWRARETGALRPLPSAPCVYSAVLQLPPPFPVLTGQVSSLPSY